MRFKVGDTVRVREDLEVGKDYGGQRFTEDMNKYKGEIATISYINEFYKLYIGNPCWYWTDEMLEPVEEKLFDNWLMNGDFMNQGHGQLNTPGKRVIKNIIGFEEKNCDNCKNYNTYFDCSQCSDFDEWEEKEDLIHKPLHYTYSKYEPIDVIKEWNLDFDLGKVVKYIARCEHKGNKLLDLNKALEYLQHEIKHLEN